MFFFSRNIKFGAIFKQYVTINWYEIQAYLQNMEIIKYRSNFTKQNVIIKTTKQGKNNVVEFILLNGKHFWKNVIETCLHIETTLK